MPFMAFITFIGAAGSLARFIGFGRAAGAATRFMAFMAFMAVSGALLSQLDTQCLHTKYYTHVNQRVTGHHSHQLPVFVV